MKTNKKILIYPVIIIIVAAGFGLIWNQFSQREESLNSTQKESPPAQKESGDNTRVFFASNGKNKVYKIKKDNKWSVIWNGKEGKSYDYVSNPVFSSDGTQLAYSAELDGQSWVVLNNEQEYFAYKKAASLVFSNDGKTLAFVAIKENASVVVVNGQESREYQTVENFETPTGTTAIIFSPDGQQIVYVVTENGKTFIVINGEEGRSFDDITEIYFDENNQLVYEAQQGGNTVTVINNQIVSTEPNTDSGNSPPPSESNDQDDSSDESSGSNSQKPYRYKNSTTKDIDWGSDDSVDYGNCLPGATCNF